MIELILHLTGDYLTQSDWMAQNKTKSTWAAFCHATVYSLPFLLIGSLSACLVIWSTHLLIDRFRLARYVVWAKNFLAPRWIGYVESETDHHPVFVRNHPWHICQGTGYHRSTEPWLAVWLMIAADNTLHLAINHLALLYL
jgi:hypothetical protein